MAQLNFYGVLSENAIVNPPPLFVAATTPTLIRLESAVERDEYFGIFSYDASGNVSGTVTAIGIYTRNFSFEPWMAWASFAGSWDARTIQNLVESFDPNLLDYLMAGSDIALGSSANDFILTLGGDDTVVAGAGNDTILTGAGDDAVSGEAGNDDIATEDGNDTLDGGAGSDTLDGGSGNDTYVIDSLADLVIDISGIDTLQSFVAGTLPSFLENLTLLGSAGFAVGNEWNNTITGNSVSNTRLSGLGGADLIFGGAGNDWIEGESGNDPLPGGHVAAGDTLHGEDGDDTVLAGDGADVVYGGAGTDFLIGEAGGDLLYGGSEWDAIDGRQGSDVLYGEGGADILFGDGLFYTFGFANDSLFGGDDNDTIMGEAGEASLSGADDAIYGEAGNDLLDGGAGNDVVYGGEGHDVIDGDHGNDYIVGGPQPDIMLGSNAVAFGGATVGSDLFVYHSLADAGDSIFGFDMRPGDNDGIDLRALFDALGYSGNDPRSAGFMRVIDLSGDAQVQIDANGATGGASYSTMLTLVGVNATSLTDSFFLFQ